MPEPDLWMDLSCPGCGWRIGCGPAAMLERLRAARMLRPGADIPTDLLGEVFRSAATRDTCPECKRQGLVAGPPAEADANWSDARCCAACGRPIPRERLEVSPGAQLCVGCQSGDERGRPVDAPEYCPHCGNIMQLSISGRGVARYQMRCPACRRRG